MENKMKEIDHCINIIKGVARICGDDKDQLYVLIESYNQLTQENARNEQDQMRRCRAAVACLIGMLVQRGVLHAEDMAYFMGMFDGIIKEREEAGDE